MTPDTQPSLIPPWAVNLLAWFSLLILGAFGSVYWFFHRRYFSKVDHHAEKIAEFPSTYATIQSVAAVDKRLDDTIPGLATKMELIAYMRQMEDNFERRHQETRTDRKAMHEENKEQNKTLRSEIASSNEALRNDVRAVHGRVDELFSK